MSILAAIAVLAVLIFVHELGHFLAARLQHIHVNRFSIGFGPILWKYQGSETEYAIRGLPLGGYVGFPDDDPESTIPKNDPNLLSNRPVLDRAIVISAGVIANLIFAYLLLVTQIGIIGVPSFNQEPGVKVAEVTQNVDSAAHRAGIESKDIILAVDGQELGASETSIKTLIAAIQTHPNQPLSVQIKRQDQLVSVNLVPDLASDGKGRIGVQLTANGTIVRHRAANPIEALSKGATEFQRIINLTASGFGQLISRFSETAEQLSGPVGIVKFGADIARSDPWNLLQFAALISINLAFINILPLPALDGGQLAFLLFEALSGKPLPEKIQENVMQTGLMLLLGLGVFLIIRDTINLTDLGWVRSLFQQ
jgi:membrane-associated protease RseP (regulator of RpoE activity)